MARSSRIATIVIGLALTLLVLAMTPLVVSTLIKTVFVASGLALIFATLVAMQIRFFEEGDRKKAAGDLGPAPPEVRPAPSDLKNPRLRTLWENMDRTRSLMGQKEEEATRREALREKALLGLPEEEEILFIGERSWLWLWPLALVSLTLIVCSAGMSGESSIVGFACLALALFCLLVTTAARTRKKYYLTNHRLLVRTRSMLGRAPVWSAMHYDGFETCKKEEGFPLAALTLVGDGKTFRLSGLTRSRLALAHEILRANLKGRS